jgi:hypothetical protein
MSKPFSFASFRLTDLFARPSRALIPAATFALFALACGSSEKTYAAQDQDEAIRSVSGSFRSDDGVCLTLGEDTAAPRPAATCGSYLVRSNGRGERLRDRGGFAHCGGCPYDLIGMARGELRIGTGDALEVKGVFDFGTEDAPFSSPYGVTVGTTDPENDVSFWGKFDGRDTLTGTLVTTIDNGRPVTLRRFDGSCAR